MEPLLQIRQQAVADARTAWDAEDRYFAPILFQPLKRDTPIWEVALTEITSIGWHLDSWQVIGFAPEPLNRSVTMIQTLFKR